MFEFEKTPLYNPDDDGIKHINIYSQGRTELGRMLSNFYHSPFTFEPYGTFQSAEGFYFWYLTGQVHHELKYMYGAEAKKAGTKYRTERLDVLGLTEDDLKVMMQMLVHKVLQNENILSLLKSSTLPFCHYYSYKERVVIPNGVDWLSGLYEDIRTALCDGN